MAKNVNVGETINDMIWTYIKFGIPLIIYMTIFFVIILVLRIKFPSFLFYIALVINIILSIILANITFKKLDKFI